MIFYDGEIKLAESCVNVCFKVTIVSHRYKRSNYVGKICLVSLQYRYMRYLCFCFPRMITLTTASKGPLGEGDRVLNFLTEWLSTSCRKNEIH